MAEIDRISAEVIERFDAAALDPTAWMQALQALADATRSEHAQLVGLGGPAAVSFNWVTGVAEKVLADFIAIDGSNPAINPRVAAAAIYPGQGVLFERHYDAMTPSLKSDVYADFCATHDLAHGCHTTLVQDEVGLVGMAVLRTRRAKPTGERDRAVMAQVAPHARAAVRLRVALEREGARLVAGAFEAVSAAAFLCDGAGRVSAYTPAAERLVDQGRLHMAGGQLSGSTAAETAALQQAIWHFTTWRVGQATPRFTTLLLPGQPGDTPLIAEIARLPDDGWTIGAGARVLILLRSRQAGDRRLADILVAAYGLSPAEADVTLRLLDAQGRDAIALARGVSIATVRAQIKAIFAKIGVNRETELISQLAPLIHGAR